MGSFKYYAISREGESEMIAVDNGGGDSAVDN